MKLNEALRIKTEKRIAAMEQAESRRAELHIRLPRTQQIDALLQDIPMRLITGEDAEMLKRESEELVSERSRLLTAAGYDPDYDEPKFECTLCNDGGYCGLKLCRCIKEMLTQNTYRESPLAKGLVGKTFENFSLEFYAEGNERAHMEKLLEGCKRYAASFPDDNSSGLFFHGGTGLGKTHLTAAIATKVADKGMSVIYESAQQIYDTLDAVRFNRADMSERKKYETCSLLIIDDLGAEYMNQYNVSVLTGMIDLRIVNGKKTIISSNLNPAGLRKTYGERLYSRIIGEFRVLQFLGKDIRMQKNKG